MVFRLLGAALLVVLIIALVRTLRRLFSGSPPVDAPPNPDMVEATTCPYCGIYVAEPPEFIDEVCSICHKKRQTVTK